MQTTSSTATRVAVLYAVFAGAWIVISDAVLAVLADGGQQSGQTLKGLGFVATTAILLYLVLRYEHQRQQRVHEKLSVNEAILQNTGDMILLVQTDGTIQRANPAAETALNIPTAQLQDRAVLTLVAPEYRNRFESAWAAVLARRTTRRLEIAVQGHDAPPVETDVILSPIIDNDELQGVVCTMRDISAWKRLEMWLRNMLTQAVEQASQSTQFVSIASHEIRTPLATIRLASDLLANYGDRISDAERQQKLEQIRDNVADMAKLLEDVLTITRNTSGKIAFTRQAVDPRTLCNDVLAVHREITKDAYRFVFKAHDLCEQVHVDPRLMQQMLNNLLSNATKYSPPGSTVTLEAFCQDDRLYFSVRDEGIGIPQTDQQRLFETFFRAGNVGSAPGTGLGLAIVKQAVDLHGGTIGVESTEGQGTTITVQLPLPSDVESVPQHATNMPG